MPTELSSPTIRTVHLPMQLALNVIYGPKQGKQTQLFPEINYDPKHITSPIEEKSTHANNKDRASAQTYQHVCQFSQATYWVTAPWLARGQLIALNMT